MANNKKTPALASPERPAIAEKKRQVEEISGKIKSAKVVGLINLTKLPDRFLQKARKGLRGKAEFISAKNSVLARSIEKAGKAKDLLPLLNTPAVLILSSESPYSLSQFFRDNRGKVAAKPGQLAMEDLIVPEGETNLPPGPALSELKGAGINAQIKGGKIVVAKDSTVAKKGEKISDAACKALQKLGILPFEIGVHMESAIDADGLAFSFDSLDIDNSKISPEEMRALAAQEGGRNIHSMLLHAISQAQNMSLNGSIYSESTVELLLQKAMREGMSLEKLEAKPAEEKKEGEAAPQAPAEGSPAPSAEPSAQAPAPSEPNPQA